MISPGIPEIDMGTPSIYTLISSYQHRHSCHVVYQFYYHKQEDKHPAVALFSYFYISINKLNYLTFEINIYNESETK